jgi:hypothetical protein
MPKGGHLTIETSNVEFDEVYAAANHLAYPEYPESDLNVATLRFGSGTLGSRKNGKAPKAGSDIELVVAGIGSLQNSLAPRLRRRAAS